MAPPVAVAVVAEPRLPAGEPALPVPWWVRLRSAVALGVVSALLGVATAAGVGIVLVLLFGLLRSSVG